jgi:hypothetical protein
MASATILKAACDDYVGVLLLLAKISHHHAQIVEETSLISIIFAADCSSQRWCFGCMAS